MTDPIAEARNVLQGVVLPPVVREELAMVAVETLIVGWHAPVAVVSPDPSAQGPCLIATKNVNGAGRAVIPKGRQRLGTSTPTTARWMWGVLFGPPGALHVLHRCGRHSCVSPLHWYLGTPADNPADARRHRLLGIPAVRRRRRAG